MFEKVGNLALTRKALAVGYAATVGLFFVHGPLHAQEAPDQSTPKTEEIVVTGSRIVRQDYDSASPIVTQTQDSLQQAGSINVESALNQLPQFTPAQGSTTNALGGGGRATLNLRGLGEQRNLVLLDGRRLPPSNALGVVDVNVIPQSILEGVEVISGGASAVYGSDAVSGVVNFKSLKDFQGVQLDAQYGAASGRTAAQKDISITAGGNLANNKGNALLSMDYSERELLQGNQRSFYNTGVPSGFLATGTALTAGNNPSQAAINAVFAKYGYAVGTVPRTTSLGFNNDGTLFAVTGGSNFKQPDGNSYGVVNGSLSEYTVPQNSIVSPMKRYSLFGKFTYDFDSSLHGYAQVLYMNSDVKMFTGYPLTLGTPPFPTVPTTNPFIPADLLTLLNSRVNPTAPFTLFKRFQEVGKRIYDEPFNTYQLLAGLNGELPLKDWTWDVYASHDATVNDETLSEGAISSRVQALLNAPDGGASICAGGYNPFGVAAGAALSPACQSYIAVPIHNTTNVSQSVIEATVQGGITRLPAGDLRAAFTASYRKNQYSFSPDGFLVPFGSGTVADVYATTPAKPTSASTDVKEYSAELLIPVVEDLPLVKSLNLDLGYRYSDYNVSGGTSTYKAESDWHPITSVLVRAGYERAIRAPNIAEFFSAPTGGVVQLGPTASGGGDPCDITSTSRNGANAASVRALCLATGVASTLVGTYTSPLAVGNTLTGNPSLQPETADTITFGLAWSPKFDAPLLSNVSASVDYYNIKVDKVISPIDGLTVLNKCYNLDGSNPSYSASNFYCGLLSRDPSSGVINNISTPYLNLGNLKTNGVDLQLDWGFGLGAIGLDDSFGKLSFNTVINYLGSYSVTVLPGSQSQEYRGTIGNPPLPKWKAISTVTYQVGPAQVGLRWHYLNAMQDVTSVTNPASPAPGVPSYNLFDLIGSWRVAKGWDLRAGINNVANKSPLVVAGVSGATNPALYDVIGRYVYAGLRVTY